VLPLKGFRNLLEAWSRLPADLHERSTLAIVGDGVDLPQLRSLAAAYGLTNIRFAGAQTPSELARYYAAADIFVLSSLAEVWGLVVNEAMSFGLPVLASQYAGASQELVKPEVGRLFDPADVAQFAQVLREWAEAPPPKNRHACWQIMDRVSFDQSVEGITGMLRSMGIT
jgi:glycosyltransferase involved in cell wall biosynthesis